MTTKNRKTSTRARHIQDDAPEILELKKAIKRYEEYGQKFPEENGVVAMKLAALREKLSLLEESTTQPSIKTISHQSGNRGLSDARKAKQDEFYTQLPDIENELRWYKAQLRGKVIFCNCDDPFESNFFKYFALNFNALGLKKLIATSYVPSAIAGKQLPLLEIEGLKPDGKEPFKIEINVVPDVNHDGATDLADVEYLLRHEANIATPLKGNGDFRSDESVDLLKQADIVCTNPPFSLFREFLTQIVKYKKKFLVIGHQNAITYKEVFKLIEENKVWLGVDNGGTKWFRVPDDYDIQTESRKKIVEGVKYFSMGSIMWFTNLDHPRRHEKIPLYENYTPEKYPKYDNYDAIEVGRVSEIPAFYAGAMGVPITFLDKYNPEQFEIIGTEKTINVGGTLYVNGRGVFKRLIIKHKNNI